MLNIERFKPYSTNGKAIISDTNSKEFINWSSIIDKLIRLAAKNTESYASDVFVSIECIKEEFIAPDFQKGVWLFGFRRDGVDHKEWILNKREDELREYRTIYRLDFIKGKWEDSYFFKLYEVSYSSI